MLYNHSIIKLTHFLLSNSEIPTLQVDTSFKFKI